MTHTAGLLVEPVDWRSSSTGGYVFTGNQSRDGGCRSVYPASSLVAAVPVADYWPDAGVTKPLMPMSGGWSGAPRGTAAKAEAAANRPTVRTRTCRSRCFTGSSTRKSDALASGTSSPARLQRGAPEVAARLPDGSIDAAQVIAEFIEVAKHLKGEQDCGARLKMNGATLAFYYAIRTNDAAVLAMEGPAL